MSEEAKDLINLILNPDPTQRFTIKDIRNHPWYNQVSPDEKKGIIVGRDQIPINTKIMELLNRDYGIDIEKCETDVKRNRFNDLTTSYYLISKRKERAGIFRQQYKDELMQMMAGKKKKAAIKKASPAPEEVIVSGQDTARRTDQ